MPSPYTPVRDYCPCCDALPRDWVWEMVSEFVNQRVFGRGPYLEQVLDCEACGCVWTRCGLGPRGAALLYSAGAVDGGEGFEPWLWREPDDSEAGGARLASRRRAMEHALRMAQGVAGPRPKGACLDYGGSGAMLRDVSGRPKWSLGGAELEPWSAPAPNLDEIEGCCAFVVNALVLQRMDDPLACLLDAARLVEPGGWIYVETPRERWRQQGGMDQAERRAWLEWLLEHPAWFGAVDWMSTAWLGATGSAPWFGFWSMRESLNFFEPASLKALAKRAGLYSLWSGRAEDSLAMVLGKPKRPLRRAAAPLVPRSPAELKEEPKPRWRVGSKGGASEVPWC